VNCLIVIYRLSICGISSVHNREKILGISDLIIITNDTSYNHRNLTKLVYVYDNSEFFVLLISWESQKQDGINELPLSEEKQFLEIK